MKRTVCVAVFTAILACGTSWAQMGKTAVLLPSAAGTAHPSAYNFPAAEFPRIEADNRVTFQFKAPDAQKVQVSIANVPFDMVRGENGIWTLTTAEPQDLGYHNYWMIVDGAIVLDPGTEAFIGYGHMCNAFEVPDPNGGFYQLRDVPHGNVLIKNYYATSINSWRHIYVYTPPDYEKSPTRRYPVLYLQHGGGEDERVWTEMGRTNVILDNLLAEGKITPFIVVMETSAVGGPGPVSGRGVAPGAPGGGAYGRLMVKDLIPWVDSNFRTLADQPHRAMAGLSMGAMQTRMVTLANIDKFSHIGLFSGGTISVDDVNNTPGFKENVKLVFVSYGSREIGANRGGGRGPGAMRGFGGDPQASIDALKTAGIDAAYFVSPLTAHEFQSWRRSLREFALLLFKDKAGAPAPIPAK